MVTFHSFAREFNPTKVYHRLVFPDGILSFTEKMCLNFSPLCEMILRDLTFYSGSESWASCFHYLRDVLAVCGRLPTSCIKLE